MGQVPWFTLYGRWTCPRWFCEHPSNQAKKLFQLSEKSDVKYYAIVLSNVWQGCCPTSEHTNHVLAAIPVGLFLWWQRQRTWWSKGGRIPRVSVIDHTCKLHIYSALCCCGGRVVEILRHRVCACIHARTYLCRIGTCCLRLSAYMERIAVLRAAPKHPMASFLIDSWFWACRQIRNLDCRTESFARR